MKSHNFGYDMFKQHEILLLICYSTQKSDIGKIIFTELIKTFISYTEID